MKAIASKCFCTSLPSSGRMGAMSVVSMYIWYWAFGWCSKLKTVIYIVKFFKNDINRLMSHSQTDYIQGMSATFQFRLFFVFYLVMCKNMEIKI